jgi:integrative and conjugative element protein (TIGR02256 family)
MTALAWRTVDGAFGLRIEEAASRELDRLCSDAGELETGGVLIGRYSSDLAVAVILEVSPPPEDSHRGRSWFERGVAGLQEMFRWKWRSGQRTHYVGEWHYHPAAIVEPSGEDLAQMHRISRSSGYQCREPIMLIMGSAGLGQDRPMRAFVFPHDEDHLEFERPRVPGQ